MRADQQQRRNRHHRGDLQDHRVGIKRIFDQPRLIEQDRKPDSAGGKINSESAKPAFVWYEVRKSDTLAGIARRTLGSEKRYREIQRMNSDIIQDINRLKPGMKIRVPVKGATEGTATASAG